MVKGKLLYSSQNEIQFCIITGLLCVSLCHEYPYFLRDLTLRIYVYFYILIKNYILGTFQNLRIITRFNFSLTFLEEWFLWKYFLKKCIKLYVFSKPTLLSSNLCCLVVFFVVCLGNWEKILNSFKQETNNFKCFWLMTSMRQVLVCIYILWLVTLLCEYPDIYNGYFFVFSFLMNDNLWIP